MADWIVLGAAAMGAGGALAGQWLSARNERARLAMTLSRDRQQRREDLRRAAYQATIAAIDDVIWISADINRPLTPDSKPEMRELDEAVRRLDAADSRVQLVGSARARAVMQELLHLISNELRPATAGHGDWDRTYGHLKELYLTFVAAARADIGLTDNDSHFRGDPG